MASSYGTDADKSSLRSNYLTARRRIDPATKAALDARIRGRLEGFEIYVGAELVLAYVSYGNEVDTRFVIESALASGKRVAVPRVSPHKHKMDFFEISGMGDLAEGFKGILEPKRGLLSPLGTEDLLGSVCLVPGLVFDSAGHRIGYGGGYYDRFLPLIPDTYKIGVCFPFQMITSIPAEEHDIKMDEIITSQ